MLGLGITSSTQAQKLQKKTITHFGQISVAGTGCSASSIASIVEKTTGTLRVLFDSFDAGSNASSRLRRTGCSITVPISIAKGYQLSQSTANWIGFTEGKGRLSRKYSFSSRPTTGWKRKTYRNPAGGNFSAQDTISLSTSCEGGTYNLRINVRLRAFNKKSYIAMSSHDLLTNSGLRLSKLSYKPCR